MLEFLLSKKFIWKNGMGKIRCFVRRNNTSENCLPQWNARAIVKNSKFQGTLIIIFLQYITDYQLFYSLRVIVIELNIY